MDLILKKVNLISSYFKIEANSGFTSLISNEVVIDPIPIPTLSKMFFNNY